MVTDHARIRFDDAVSAVTARADNMLGARAAGWSDEQCLAWEGLLEVAKVMRRDAEVHLEDAYGISISMLGILGRLTTAPDGALRLTDLADSMGLSISRISRIIDALEQRDLVHRAACPTDARATHVVLQSEGRRQAKDAQGALEAFARDAFLARLTQGELATLAGVFGRLIDSARGDAET